MKKVIVGIVLMTLLLVSTMSLVSAATGASNIEISGDEDFSFIRWFKHTFFIQEFSVVGDFRQCGPSLAGYEEFSRGDSVNVYANDYCSGTGLLDVFTEGYEPFMEFPNSLTSSTCSSDTCHIEIYCCDEETCDDDNDCEDWYGEGSECEEVDCTPWKNGGYKCTAEGVVETEIPYYYDWFRYCTAGGITCYYNPPGKDYCRDRFYAGEDDCPPTYINQELFEDEDDCEDNIGTSHASKKCYADDVYWYDSNDNREDKFEECGALGCSNGACNTDDDDDDLGACDDYSTRAVCELVPGCEWKYNILYWQCEGTPTGNGDGNGGDGVVTMTWTEFYSTSNDDISFFGIFADSPICKSNDECPSLEGYTVTCDKSKNVKKRIYDARKEYCKDITIVGGPIGWIQRIVAWVVPGDFCGIIITSYEFIGNAFTSEPGMCMASSDSWYGGLWEDALKMVGGFGLPAQYVMIITAMFLITLIGVVIRMFT